MNGTAGTSRCASACRRRAGETIRQGRIVRSADAGHCYNARPTRSLYREEDRPNMSYFIYKITPGPGEMIKQLEHITQFESFQEAKAQARSMRAELGQGSPVTIKIIFAANQLEAEDKLQEHREAPILAEWEK